MKEIPVLDGTARATLAAVADTLIPGDAAFPSATAAGVSESLIDQVLGYRLDLVADFNAALAACAGEAPESALDQLVSTSPEQFDALSTLISGAYLRSPQVQRALNYQPAPRPAHDDVDSYVDLLEKVVGRGFDIHGV
jgi:hypothetical protein